LRNDVQPSVDRDSVEAIVQDALDLLDGSIFEPQGLHDLSEISHLTIDTKLNSPAAGECPEGLVACLAPSPTQ